MRITVTWELHNIITRSFLALPSQGESLKQQLQQSCPEVAVCTVGLTESGVIRNLWPIHMSAHSHKNPLHLPSICEYNFVVVRDALPGALIRRLGRPQRRSQRCENKISATDGNRTPNRRSSSPQLTHCIDWAIMDHIIVLYEALNAYFVNYSDKAAKNIMPVENCNNLCCFPVFQPPVQLVSFVPTLGMDEVIRIVYRR
jgi:hypothetical protein